MVGHVDASAPAAGTPRRGRDAHGSRTAAEEDREDYDYIVVGGGSAGCVLAARLTEDPGVRVLLLEAGGPDRSVFIHMPAAVGMLIAGGKTNWCYETEGQARLAGRRLFWPRGKVLGGSSSINGMIYIRGHPRDYDTWRQAGLEGWGFSDVLPYFKRAEDNEDGASAYHGTGGGLSVSNGQNASVLFDAFVKAGQEAGHGITSDFNGPVQEGMGRYQLTIRNGSRCSTAVAYLRPARARAGLDVRTHARALRVTFSGQRATGVEYLHGRRVRRARAAQEVILCGGAVNSPQTLMLSGIGPGDALRRFGIGVVCDLPGVGRNLQDHLDCSVFYTCPLPVTLYAQTRPLRQIATGLRYMLFRSGLGATQGLESGAFLKTRPELDVPDVQIHFVAALVRDHARGKPWPGHGMTMHVCQLRPQSRGFIALKSADPLSPPLVQPNYLQEPADLDTLRAGVRMVRKIASQPAMDPYRGEEIWPGPDAQTDEQLDRCIARHAETIYHPVGTCRMGNDDMAVTDGQCRVRGVEALRVVDASVMPLLVGGNTNAPTIMIAEKVSDHMRGRPPLPPEDPDAAPAHAASAAAVPD